MESDSIFSSTGRLLLFTSNDILDSAVRSIMHGKLTASPPQPLFRRSGYNRWLVPPLKNHTVSSTTQNLILFRKQTGTVQQYIYIYFFSFNNKRGVTELFCYFPKAGRDGVTNNIDIFHSTTDGVGCNRYFFAFP